MDNNTLVDACIAVEEEEQVNQQLCQLVDRVESSNLLQTGGKRPISGDSDIPSKRYKNQSNDQQQSTSSQEPSTSRQATSSRPNHNCSSHHVSGTKVYCTSCDIYYCKKYSAAHLNSSFHKNNSLCMHQHLGNVSRIDTAFNKRLLTYRITSTSDFTDLVYETPELFLGSVYDTIKLLINNSIDDHKCIKINFVLHADFLQETKDLKNTFDFQTCNYTFCIGDNIDDVFELIKSEISEKISNFERRDSGWTLEKIKHIDMNVNKFNPLRGSSYIDLPTDIKNKKAIINVKNNDYECFKWAVLSALHPVTKNADRVSSYSKWQNELKFDGISFPVKLKDISKFENLNNISVNVFGLEYAEETKKNNVVGPLHFTKCRKERHINLLYYTKNNVNGHYMFIKNLSRLTVAQINSVHSAIYTCDGCLLHFNAAEKLNVHQKTDCNHVVTNLPDSKCKKNRWFGEPIPNNIIRFKNFERKFECPFVIYADFESFLQPIQTVEPNPELSFTTNIHKHEANSFGYYLKCSFDKNLSKYRSYSGENCAHVFMNSLKTELKTIARLNTYHKAPKPLTTSQQTEVAESSACFICENDLSGDTTIFHNQYTGSFLGVAHTVCCESYRTPDYVPVIIHNLSNYDAHFIVHALNLEEGKIDIIPQNKEKYISFSKEFMIGNKKMTLRFLDSFKFMASSLDKLANNLKSDQFHELKSLFPDPEDFKLLVRKGVYPYEYIKSFNDLKMTSLPSREYFYNSLTDTHISNADWSHANKVWEHFKCKTMKEYGLLYLKIDVIILSDCYENFRILCRKTYDLDPVHYFTAPGLSWDAMLKTTKIDLELLTDFEKVAFVKRGIRGGISQCSNRHAKANNKYLSNFDPDKQSSFLTYLDANNLYGWAMSQFLPTGGFTWVDPEKVDFNIPNNSAFGFILEVDLEYPENIHDSHSDLPFCPEKRCSGCSKIEKLIPSLDNKTKYIIHYRNLKQAIAHGLKLTKIHRVLKFEQSPWLKKYIDLNTEMRAKATSDFEKDFFKLMNNSIYGKTMENVEKRVNVKLVTHWENKGKIQGAQSLVAKPEFHSVSIFSENLVAIQLNKTKVLYNKPLYLGFCILEISKTLMYEFHYDYMKNKFKNIKLLYTDTDSLVYQIFTDDFYSDIKNDLQSRFDTSDYSPDNQFGFPRINKKKIGLFKDEHNGQIFKEFVGLRSKMYAMDVQNNFIAKAKGVNKSVTQKFTLENYKNCLENKTTETYAMLRFKSIKHVIYTQKHNKISLSFNDTKRFLIPNSTNTLAWGHYSLRNST